MANIGQQSSADALNGGVSMTQTDTNPSGASLTTTVIGFNANLGAIYQDFNQTNTQVGGIK